MFRSFLDHHQVHKELKYATCYKIILVRNGIPLSLRYSIKHYKIIKCDIKVNLQYVIWSRSSSTLHISALYGPDDGQGMTETCFPNEFI
jgi:hypothetical protein